LGDRFFCEKAVIYHMKAKKNQGKSITLHYSWLITEFFSPPPLYAVSRDSRLSAPRASSNTGVLREAASRGI